MHFFSMMIACLVSIGSLQAHPNQALPEEPTKLFVPADQTDLFNEQFDTDELGQEQELDNLEHRQAGEQAHPASPPK